MYLSVGYVSTRTNGYHLPISYYLPTTLCTSAVGITIPILQARKPRTREGKSSAQGHTAGEWQTPDSWHTLSQRLI